MRGAMRKEESDSDIGPSSVRTPMEREVVLVKGTVILSCGVMEREDQENHPRNDQRIRGRRKGRETLERGDALGRRKSNRSGS